MFYRSQLSLISRTTAALVFDSHHVHWDFPLTITSVTAVGYTMHSVQEIIKVLPWVKRPMHEDDHSPLHSIKNLRM
jgi:hypothetical protein